jgi:mannitol-1-phosphate 5-dehydrogenase
MLKAIQFGAGNIGRGFTAQLFTESGYEVVFVDVVDETVRLMNERRSYPIEIVGDGAETVNITNVRAVNGNDHEAVANEISGASIICTAVGVNVLKYIAPPIAKGIKLRADAGIADPLNIVICENLLHASDILRGYILDALPAEYEDYVRKHVGLVESVVSRMVPPLTEEQKAKDPLMVVVEAYKKLPVARKGFVGDIPDIVGFQPYDNFNAYVERKLFTHNLGHAVAAYLGYLRGHEYIYQVMDDPDALRVVKAAMAETGEALVKRHGFTPEEHQAHIDDLLHRFSNIALGDTVARVGKDPIRKLGPKDRLIGGATVSLQYGVTPRNVCAGIAAGLMFAVPEDAAAMKVQQMIAEKGVDYVLETISELEPGSELSNLIHSQLDLLKSGGWPD